MTPAAYGPGRRGHGLRHLSASLAVACLALAATPAGAADRCMVTDPTGTPLNVRSAPGGRTILATLPNGVTLDIGAYADDAKGKRWARIDGAKGHGEAAGGWVLREFVSCF